MKGISQTLYLIVVAVVLIVVALVLLTIFSGGIQTVVEFSEAQNLCSTTAGTSCKTGAGLPVDWTIPKHVVKDRGLMSCKMIFDEVSGICNTCEECGFPTT